MLINEVHFPRSYRVIPGLLMAGEHPGAKDSKEGAQKLSSLLDAGIRLIINLMEPDETDHTGRPFNRYGGFFRQHGREEKPWAEVSAYPICDLNVPSVDDVTKIFGTIKSLPTPATKTVESLSGGWASEEALAISIYYCALRPGDDFLAGVPAAVNHNGDRDSTGVITGNILGSSWGRRRYLQDGLMSWN